MATFQVATASWPHRSREQPQIETQKTAAEASEDQYHVAAQSEDYLIPVVQIADAADQEDEDPASRIERQYHGFYANP